MRRIALVVAFVLLPAALAEAPKPPTQYVAEVVVRKGLILGTGPGRTIRLQPILTERLWSPRLNMSFLGDGVTHQVLYVEPELVSPGLVQVRAVVQQEPNYQYIGGFGGRKTFTTRASGCAELALKEPLRLDITLEGRPYQIEVRVLEAK
jgi:hypothetical protein